MSRSIHEVIDAAQTSNFFTEHVKFHETLDDLNAARQRLQFYDIKKIVYVSLFTVDFMTCSVSLVSLDVSTAPTLQLFHHQKWTP